MIDLPLIWAVILVFGVVMYVILDGFDLGVGILFPFAPHEADRDAMMASITPLWDGNETWLVLGGAVLFGAFPIAYGILLPALYLPLILFLFALIFRGIAFEFRGKAYRSRYLWTFSFSFGSALAAFCQGIVLGGFIQGFAVTGIHYTGGAFDWATPFSLLIGLAMLAGYGLLGATWLIVKTAGSLQDWCYRMAWRVLPLVLAAILLVSIWTPLMSEDIRQRWFTLPNLFYLSPVPVLTALATLGLVRALRRHEERTPFLYTIALFLLSFLGLGISLWPYAVPRALTIHQVSSDPKSQLFLLVGVVILLPVILSYTLYAYRVFRGKVRAEDTYH